MTERSVNHATFVIERTYPAAPGQGVRRLGRRGGQGHLDGRPDYKSDGTEAELDFRVGGHERFGGTDPGGHDLQLRRHLLRHRAGPAGSSTATRCTPATSACRCQSPPWSSCPPRTGTKLTYTEQGVFLDGIDKPEAREEGTAWMLDNLGKYLEPHAES